MAHFPLQDLKSAAPRGSRRDRVLTPARSQTGIGPCFQLWCDTNAATCRWFQECSSNLAARQWCDAKSASLAKVQDRVGMSVRAISGREQRSQCCQQLPFFAGREGRSPSVPIWSEVDTQCPYPE